MSQFFDDSHVTDAGLEGSVGPSVGWGDLISQGFQQQFRVDSARALDEELRNRWTESLRLANIQRRAGEDPESADPFDPYAYRAFAQHVAGEPIDTFDANKPLFGDYDPTSRIAGMIRANEAIKKLNNPDIKTFEQILEEVSAMQHEVEGESASMDARANGVKGFLGPLIGAMAGSFTTRDPLNIITAPIGAGRTVATRIASEVALASGIVAYTEMAEVAPAREIAGLPERDPLFNIAAAGLGAGVIRGGIEGAGYGLRRLRGPEETIDFDLRDSQLQQMFAANAEKPSARAGAQALDDIGILERANPYGEGRAAQERFIAELQQVQKVMGGEPMTAVGRVLPPMPFEYIKKVGDFEIVREQAPQVYARMEEAQARLKAVTQETEKDLTSDSISLVEAVRVIDNEAANQLERLSVIVNDEKVSDSVRASVNEGIQTIIQRVGAERITKAADTALSRQRSQTLNTKRIANKEYSEAVRAVEAEAVRLRENQARVETVQQREAVGIFADAAQGRSFNWSALQHDHVQARVDAINTFNDTLDEAMVARFARQAEGEEGAAREAWRTEDGRVDIGLREPVAPDFRIATDDGDMSIADIMRDLQDDADLDIAMRTCLI